MCVLQINKDLTMNIEISRQRTVITDPQRRVYNGCIHSSEQVFTEFEILESEIDESEVEERLAFWVDLNNYAVSQRGEGSRNKYRIINSTVPA